MIATLLLGLLACASAAPRYHNHYHHAPRHYEDGSNMDNYLNRYIESQVFDAQRFWRELSREMMKHDTMFADFGRYSPNCEPFVHTDDKEYKITLELNGFNEKEIIVKAKTGLLVVQAVHKVAGKQETNYLSTRTLPQNVGENGSWIYEDGLLKIVFPISQVDKEIPTTTAPDYSREERGDKDEGIDEDIDEYIDVRSDNESYLKTNEIPHQENTVEATSHAVDLKDEVELLPMQRY